jgi:hypothetical protein
MTPVVKVITGTGEVNYDSLVTFLHVYAETIVDIPDMPPAPFPIIDGLSGPYIKSGDPVVYVDLMTVFDA